MLSDGCETCDRLWRDYVAATHAHLRAVGKQRIAAIQHDSAALVLLDAQERDAALEREQAQADLRHHETSHLPNVMTAR